MKIHAMMISLQKTQNGISLFNPATVTVTRYRYRGARIPLPWTAATALEGLADDVAGVGVGRVEPAPLRQWLRGLLVVGLRGGRLVGAV
ncbi:hypothetical protein QOZ89_25205 [Pseudofrankia sp. BMG5.37]|nr:MULTISPECIES: hypothetical protein [unclassified Pseudofrankia]MDT3442865.1 hypothetical protein [Pseudofrankia sp. BMG5.37]